VFAFHSGGSAASIQVVPGDARLPTDARDWNERWRSMGTRLFTEVEKALKAGKPVPTEILALGDSDFDTRAQKNSAKSASVTYGPRHRDKTGNYGAMSAEVAKFYLASGIHYEMVGHMPQPLPMMLKSDVGPAKVYNDMSFANDGSQAMVVTQGDLLVMAGRHKDAAGGELVFFSMRPGDKSPLGKLTKDGFAIHSLSLDGRYNLMRVANGRELEWKKVTAEELATLEPRGASLDEKTEITSESWFASLGEDFNVHTPDTLTALFDGRTPVWVSGASSFGELPLSPGELDKLFATLPAALGDRVAFVTGGTNVEKTYVDSDGASVTAKAPEYRLHELAADHSIPAVGFVPEQTNTGILGTKDLFVTGKKSQWGVPLEAGLSMAGAAVFIGGGGTITKAVAEAVKNPKVPVFLVVGADFADRVKSGAAGRGASEQSALDLVRAGGLPAHIRLVKPGDDLGGRMKQALRARAGAATGT
jgi:hypothetical protein